MGCRTETFSVSDDSKTQSACRKNRDNHQRSRPHCCFREPTSFHCADDGLAAFGGVAEFAELLAGPGGAGAGGFGEFFDGEVELAGGDRSFGKEWGNRNDRL